MTEYFNWQHILVGAIVISILNGIFWFSKRLVKAIYLREIVEDEIKLRVDVLEQSALALLTEENLTAQRTYIDHLVKTIDGEKDLWEKVHKERVETFMKTYHENVKLVNERNYL